MKTMKINKYNMLIYIISINKYKKNININEVKTILL